MLAIVAIEAQDWTDDQWEQWECLAWGWQCNDWPWCWDCSWWNWKEDLNKAKEANRKGFQFCDEDGEIGLTWDELQNCEVNFLLNQLIHERTVDIFFSSNHNIHKSSFSLCLWTSDPLIERFW